MKIIVKIAGEELECNVNMKKDFDLRKYRIKLQASSNELRDIPKSVLKELQNFDAADGIDSLSKEAQDYLMTKANSDPYKDITYDDIIDILSILAEIDRVRAEELINIEYENSGSDKTIIIVMNALTEVFMGAKSGLETKTVAKKELNRVAKTKTV